MAVVIKDKSSGKLITLNRKEVKRRKRVKSLEAERDKRKAIRREFLREQILKHDRIDLLMTEILGYQVEDFHLLMWLHRKKRYKKIGKQKWHLALAPRGGGKTTILTISSIVLDVLKNPNIRILIASKTDSNSVAFLSEIKKKLESKKLQEIFGQQKGDIWNDGAINIASRTSSSKEFTVTAIGHGSALASKHYDKIYADDLVDEFNSLTDGQREKIRTWVFKVLDPCLEPDGEMSFIGTRYHHEDLYGNLIDTMLTRKKAGKVVARHYIRIPALIKKANVPAGAPKHERYISFWPEKFAVKFLLKKRKTQGSIIFNSQMQNDVQGMKGKIFKFEWFQWCKLEDICLSELRIYQGVDLAIKQRDTADKFAHCTIGIHPKTKNIYVLNYFNRVTHYSLQKKVIKDRFDRYDPIRVAVEANGYQRSLLQDMQTDDKLKAMRAVPVFTDTDKTVRAWKLSAYFERGQVWLLEGMVELQEHLLKIPDGRYKDLFDALDIAVTVAFGRQKRIREKEPGLI